MHCCWYIWAAADQTTLSSFDIPKKRLRSLVGDYLFSCLQTKYQRRKITKNPLLYHYYFDRHSAEIHCWVHTFIDRTWHVISTVAYHLPSFRFPLIKCKFHSKNFPQKTVTSWDKHSRDCIPDYNTDFFKYSVNRYIFYSPS